VRIKDKTKALPFYAPKQLALAQWKAPRLDGLQYEAPAKLRSPADSSRFSRKTLTSVSGAEGNRTPDLRRAKAALSRLSYGPGRIER